MDTNREEILRVEHLKQHFKLGSGRSKAVNKAVDDISFTIYKGEVFSLVGESGCGKTTTGRTIIKLYQSSGGEVYFHGTRIVADVKKAKKEHLNNVAKEQKVKAEKVAQLDKQIPDKKSEAYLAELSKINEVYNEKINETLKVLQLARRDSKFETIKDSDALRAKEHIETFPEYKEILAKYAAKNKEAEHELTSLKKKLGQSNLDKDEVKKIQNNITQLEKEIKLNALRQKQDISKLKYSIIHKNRLLMRRMQMIFQDPIASLNPRMTVKEIIGEGLRINGVKNEAEIDDRVKEALKIVGLLPEHASRYPHEFSGGQRQRIGIARALVVEPSFIIADEPISALDVSIRAQVINLLNDLRETRGITILFIAHDLSVVKYFTDRLAVMYFGHIVEIGDKDAIFNHPLHPYTKSLLASIPLPDPEFEKNRVRSDRYNPQTAHDYSKDKPTLQEIEKDHFVMCNQAEFETYKAIVNKQ